MKNKRYQFLLQGYRYELAQQLQDALTIVSNSGNYEIVERKLMNLLDQSAVVRRCQDQLTELYNMDYKIPLVDFGQVVLSSTKSRERLVSEANRAGLEVADWVYADPYALKSKVKSEVQTMNEQTEAYYNLQVANLFVSLADSNKDRGGRIPGLRTALDIIQESVTCNMRSRPNNYDSMLSGLCKQPTEHKLDKLTSLVFLVLSLVASRMTSESRTNSNQVYPYTELMVMLEANRLEEVFLSRVSQGNITDILGHNTCKPDASFTVYRVTPRKLDMSKLGEMLASVPPVSGVDTLLDDITYILSMLSPEKRVKAIPQLHAYYRYHALRTAISEVELPPIAISNSAAAIKVARASDLPAKFRDEFMVYRAITNSWLGKSLKTGEESQTFGEVYLPDKTWYEAITEQLVRLHYMQRSSEGAYRVLMSKARVARRQIRQEYKRWRKAYDACPEGEEKPKWYNPLAYYISKTFKPVIRYQN